MTNVTGRDSLIIVEALAYAIAHIQKLPPEDQEFSDMLDMIALLKAAKPSLVQVVIETVERKTGVKIDLDLHDPKAV